ncbi:MAG: hypothetical protein K6G28_05610, partial [Acholeplasmatales bacterium]|nr:hypothetical protein [Acholeplasmatales bacterium]
DFYKFYNKNIDTDKLSVFTIGKNIIDTSSTNYDKILDYPRVCYVLGKINKNELILFVGNNNYDYENFIDIELLDYLDDEDIRVLDDYFRTLPSFIDVSENSLFINPRVGNDVDSVVSLLYRQATITYKKRVDQEEVNSDSKLDDHIRKLQISMLENNFSIVDDMIETYDLTEKDEQFLLSLKSSKEQEYAVLKCRKDGIELVNTKTLDTYLVKIELNNYYRDHKLIPHLAHITLAVYDSNLIMFTYAPGRDLMKEELDKYNDIFKHSTEIKKSL